MTAQAMPAERKGQNLLPGVTLPERRPRDTGEDAGRSFAEPDYPEFVDGLSDSPVWPSAGEMLGAMVVFEPRQPLPHPLDILGVPLGQPLNEAQRKRVRQAEVIAAETGLLHRLFPQWNTAKAPRTAASRKGTGKKAGGKAVRIELVEYLPLDATHGTPSLQRLAALHAAGKNIVALCEGDPLFWGMGEALHKLFAPAELRLTPALSALQEAARRLALPWQHVRSLSLRKADGPGAVWHRLHLAVGEGCPLCVFTDAHIRPDELARHLLDRGVDWFGMQAFEHLGGPNERHRACSLSEAAGTDDWGEAAVVLLLPEAAPRRPFVGMDGAHLSDGAEDMPDDTAPDTPPRPAASPLGRALALHLARCRSHHILWCVGVHDPLLPLECAALAHQGAVFAIERAAGKALGLRELRRRHGAANLEVLNAAAPDCFARLPRPHGILLDAACLDNARPGAPGEAANALLDAACTALHPGGRLVLLCRHLRSLNACLNALPALRAQDWRCTCNSQQCATSPGEGPERTWPPLYAVACVKPGNAGQSYAGPGSALPRDTP